MDPDSGAETQKAVSLQWKSYKLVQDPAIRRVTQKIYRYDGVHFSVPDSGFPPVGDLRDPRPRRLWSRYTELSLPVPKFKLDEFYVGPIPLKEVTFARLNDNIKEPFLAEMCAKFGEVEEMEILFHPKTRKHLGLARVLFTSTRGAKDTVKHLHNTSVMGNIIHAQLDIKGQQRQKYYDLIVNGSYTPQTVPLGGKALTDRVQAQAPTQPQPQPDTPTEMRRRISSELAVLAAGVQAMTSGGATPCSTDTGYSDQRLDTPPPSMTGPFTPGSSASSQAGGGTPYSSRSGTPFSQDSGYTSTRHTGYNTGSLGSGYPPQDMLPSSSSSSAVSSTVGGYKVSRYPDDAQEYHRGRPVYPPTGPYRPNEPPCYPPYSNVGGPGLHMPHHSSMPPPPISNQYDQAPMLERERERDRDSGGRYGAGAIGSRRSSYHHQQDTNSSSKYHSHHSHHHSERREERGYRRDSLGSRSVDHGHQRHRNHHHSHNHHGSSSRRRSSHDRDRDRDRDRDSDYSNSSDPRYNSNSYRSSSNSQSPPPSSYSAYSSSSSKEAAPAPPQGPPDASSRPGSAGLTERAPLPSAGADKEYHAAHHSTLPPPPPPPPPLPPASVIAAAVAETLGTLDFNHDSPVCDDQWKPKRRPSTPPAPPKTPPPPSSPAHPSAASSSNSPSSASLPLHLSSSSSSPPPPHRDSSSPEPDSTNESLPFVYHSSSLDSRIEMLLKEQKAKFSFLASDEEEEDNGKEDKPRGRGGDGAERRGRAGDAGGEQQHVGDGGEKEHRKKGERDRDGHRGRKRGKGGDSRKSPTVPKEAPLPSATYPPHVPPPEEPQAPVSLPVAGAPQEECSQAAAANAGGRTGAHTPPFNGQSQASPHSSGEDMEISDEEEEDTAAITTVTTHQPPVTSGSSPSTSQAALSQTADPSSSPPPISDSSQHFGNSMHPPIPSYPPHLPPPPPPGYSLQPPPPPGIPPLPHMELHPEYPPPMPHHMYDYATSMELMNQYSGGTPMSFQMQTHMLSRLHQLRMSSSNGTPGPGEAATADYSSYHLHPMPPPHSHHPYMDQEGSGAGAHYDQDPRYMPPHMSYPYADPHSTQIPAHPHHNMPPHHAGWPPHVLPPHYASYLPPPGYSTLLPADGEEYRAPGEEMSMLADGPHEATVQMVLATLIQEMKNIMQRDLNRKMVENVAFATFDEWWERKETKAKPFQTMVRGVSALRDEEKKEEKVNRPREPLMSLVDWAKSGGVEGFSLRGALRLPSFKVKRKEPQEFEEEDMKRPRPSTPPDEDDEAADGRPPEADRRGAERDNKRRKKKPRTRKPWELDSEGEETSDGSSSEKEDEEVESEKESDDDALSADSDDESLSSSSDGSSSSASSSSSSSEDEEEGEQVESEGPDSLDDSTMDSTTEKEDDGEHKAAALSKAELKKGLTKDNRADAAASTKHPPSPQYPRPSSPIVLVPPLKKRRKTVSFSTDENEGKTHLPGAQLSPSQGAGESLLISGRPSDSPITAALSPTGRPGQGIQLLPFASKPGEGNALIVPPSERTQDSEESKKGPLASPTAIPVKSPGKRGAGKDSPKGAAPPVMVCRTVQNLPLDHASMCRMAFEEAPPPPAGNKRSRGKPRTASVSSSLREEDEDEEDIEQRLRLREQLGASSLLQLASSSSTTDLSVLADVALKMDPDAGDSEETETSDEAEEQKMEKDLFSLESLALVMSPGGVIVFMEHNYCKPPVLTAPSTTKKTSSRQDSSVLLPADLNSISGVLEAPEEVIGEAAPSRMEAEHLSAVGELCDSDMSPLAAISPSPKKKSHLGKTVELEQEKSKKRRRKDKENIELHHTKKQKEQPIKKQRKRKLEDSEEDVDVEELESGELSSTDTEDEAVEEVRKSERLFLQEAGMLSSPRWAKPVPAPELPAVKYENRSEFEQMTILYDIWNSGLDGEDLMLLKKTYEKLLQDDHGSDWLNDTHWVNHTITNLPNPRRKKKSADGQLREHVTGCARSEGYYAISRKEKDVYLDLDLPEQVIREVENVDSSGVNRVLSERRSEQRRLLTVIGTTAVMDSDLLKLNQLKFRKKKLRFGRSRIHEWGLFAMEPIAADEMVIEYVGQNIRQMVADHREKRYTQQGIGSSYLFRVDHDTIIDATKCGNLARFINHCCTPNCYAKVITIESQKKIVIYSKQAIAVNEEITYDYKFPLEENKIPCLCGTENCRGTLN